MRGFPYVAREYSGAVSEHFRRVREDSDRSSEHWGLVSFDWEEMTLDSGEMTLDSEEMRLDSDEMSEHLAVVSGVLPSMRLDSTTNCRRFDTTFEDKDSARLG